MLLDLEEWCFATIQLSIYRSWLTVMSGRGKKKSVKSKGKEGWKEKSAMCGDKVHAGLNKVVSKVRSVNGRMYE